MAAVPVDVLAERAGGQAPSGATVRCRARADRRPGGDRSGRRRFVPRLFRSQATVVSAPRNGWVSVTDEVWEHDPELVGQLAQELSNVTGSVVIGLAVERGRFVRLSAYERGSLIDEYLSVPGAYGPIAPGDAVALRANPTVLGRLTGAEPAQIRAVARVAESDADLPPAPELAEQLAGVLGLRRRVSFAEAKADPEAVIVAALRTRYDRRAPARVPARRADVGAADRSARGPRRRDAAALRPRPVARPLGGRDPGRRRRPADRGRRLDGRLHRAGHGGAGAGARSRAAARRRTGRCRLARAAA